MPELTIISLGWGVQSFTLAAMAALGELPPVDFALAADTRHERTATYALAAEMSGWLKQHGVPVITVCDEAATSMVTDGLRTPLPAYTLAVKGAAIVSGTYDSRPVPTTQPIEWFGETILLDTAGGLDSVELEEGQLRRQCTHRWKIVPIRQWLTEELARRDLAKTPGVVEQWIGISQDEWSRAKTSDVKYITHRYPLLERRMTRADCVRWLEAHHLPVPGKSACVFCPYHNDRAWQQLKREGGRDYEHALEIDNLVRNARPPFPLYVHRKRLPLDQAITIPEDVGYEQSALDRAEVDDAPCDNGGCFI